MNKTLGLTRSELAREPEPTDDTPRAAPRYVGSANGEVAMWRTLAETRMAEIHRLRERVAELEADVRRWQGDATDARPAMVRMIRRLAGGQ